MSFQGLTPLLVHGEQLHVALNQCRTLRTPAYLFQKFRNEGEHVYELNKKIYE